MLPAGRTKVLDPNDVVAYGSKGCMRPVFAPHCMSRRYPCTWRHARRRLFRAYPPPGRTGSTSGTRRPPAGSLQEETETPAICQRNSAVFSPQDLAPESNLRPRSQPNLSGCRETSRSPGADFVGRDRRQFRDEQSFRLCRLFRVNRATCCSWLRPVGHPSCTRNARQFEHANQQQCLQHRVAVRLWWYRR